MDSSPPVSAKPASRPWRRWALAAAVLVIAVVAWRLPGWRAQAEAGAAYGARIGCSCRYVQGRELAQCADDFEPGMALVRLSEDAATRTVTARVPLLARARARHAGASGCLFVPEKMARKDGLSAG